MSDSGNLTPPAMEGLVWISLPEHLSKNLGDFVLDPAVMIPVDAAGDPSSWTVDRLSVESIIAGILKFLAKAPLDPNADYYRRFVATVRPGIVGELTEAAILKSKNKDFDVAEEIFLALSGLLPDSPMPLLNLAISCEDRADAYAKTGRTELEDIYNERAFGLYRDLLARKPPVPDAWFNAGFFNLKRRNFEKARAIFHKYMKIGDDDAKRARAKEIVMKLDGQDYLDSLFKEAYDFIAIGKEVEGIAKIDEFLAEYPDVWNAWFLKGWALRRLSRWEEGKDALEKACALGGADPDTLNELSICLLELGDFVGARRKLETALHKEPENVKIIDNLAIVAMKQGKTRDAEGFLRTALEIEPEDPVALQYLKEIRGIH